MAMWGSQMAVCFSNKNHGHFWMPPCFPYKPPFKPTLRFIVHILCHVILFCVTFSGPQKMDSQAEVQHKRFRD